MDEDRRAAERAAARDPDDTAARARAAAWQGRGRRARCPWAQGPAKVKPEQDFPPVGWGCTMHWDRRLKAWRARPAKERRAFPGNRVRGETMTVAVVEWTLPRVGYHDPAKVYIRWSNGDAYWPRNERLHDPYNKPPPRLGVGYWWAHEREARWAHVHAKFIGTTEADVLRFLQEHHAAAESRARDEAERLIKSAAEQLQRAAAAVSAFGQRGQAAREQHT